MNCKTNFASLLSWLSRGTNQNEDAKYVLPFTKPKTLELRMRNEVSHYLLTHSTMTRPANFKECSKPKSKIRIKSTTAPAFIEYEYLLNNQIFEYDS